MQSFYFLVFFVGGNWVCFACGGSGGFAVSRGKRLSNGRFECVCNVVCL